MYQKGSTYIKKYLRKVINVIQFPPNTDSLVEELKRVH